MNVNKIHIITDTHFGIRSNSLEWLEIMEDFFYNWYIPYLRKNVQPNDILVHCGDLWDNRQTISILTLNKVIDIFEEISKILPVYIIIGNHDIYNRSTNSVNSLRVLSYIKNIKVIQEPEIMELNNGKELFFLPWRANHEIEKQTIEENNSDYLFCHLDINGFKFNQLSNAISDTNDITLFDKYKRVFDGHLHLKQTKKNITLLGCPMQLTRGDLGNSKGVYIFDPTTDELKFIENTYSPKFIRIKLSTLLNKTFTDFQGLIKNNFVDVVVTTEESTTLPLSRILDAVNGYRKINIIIDDKNLDLQDLNISNDAELINFDILNFSKEYIDKLDYSDKLKDLINQKVTDLYKKAIREEE